MGKRHVAEEASDPVEALGMNGERESAEPRGLDLGAAVGAGTSGGSPFAKMLYDAAVDADAAAAAAAADDDVIAAVVVATAVAAVVGANDDGY